MLAFLKLIRVQNLLIIALTQYLIRWCLIFPILKAQSSYYELQLTEWQFFFLVLSTTMIAAAGYIINDYFDARIDKINKPEKIVIDKGVKRRVAMGAHMVINILAFFIGLGVSYSIGVPKLVFAHFMCISGLWFYSTTFKKQLLIGNIIIALFTAMIPFVVVVYELLACYRYYLPIDSSISFKGIWIYCFGVCVFSFLLSLVHEFIKDLENSEGDKELGFSTLPVVFGQRASKLVISVVLLAIVSFLIYYQVTQFFHSDYLTLVYFIVALQLPILYLLYIILKANTKPLFHKAIKITKGIMFAAICYLLVFAYIILHFIQMI
ncbi:MAG: geranylgeranylglycerol-phosphate geranylgeranyltransferase [Bacteroidia bacterium]